MRSDSRVAPDGMGIANACSVPVYLLAAGAEIAVDCATPLDMGIAVVAVAGPASSGLSNNAVTTPLETRTTLRRRQR